MLPRLNTYKKKKIIKIRRVVPKISVYKQTDKQTEFFFWIRALLLFLNPPQLFFFFIYSMYRHSLFTVLLYVYRRKFVRLDGYMDVCYSFTLK